MEVGFGVPGLISLADIILGKTIRYSLEVKHAEASIIAFLDETRSLLGILKQIEHTSKLYLEHELVIDASVREHIATCSQLLKEIRDSLQKGELRKSPFKKMRRDLLWPFKSTKAKELVDRLERSKSNLALAFSTDNWLATHKSNQQRISELKGLQDNIASKYISQEHRQIFKWLGEINHAKLQDNGIVLRSHLENQTGQWFLQGDQFLKWMEAKRSRLWVHGIPGAGKTVLASTIIQHIQRMLQTHEREDNYDVMAYFYCDFRDNATTKAWNILGALLKQLAEQNRECLHLLEEFYQAYHPPSSSPKSCQEEDLKQLFLKMAEQIDGDVLVIIDGLDEIEDGRVDTIELLNSLWGQDKTVLDRSDILPDNSGRTSPSGSPRASTTPTPLELAGNGSSLMHADEEPLPGLTLETTLETKSSWNSSAEDVPRIKLLFISRTQRDIESRMLEFDQQTIEARTDDLLLYVASEIDHRISKGHLRFQDRSLKEDIIDGLVSHAQGMFRWVACQIDYLCKLPSDGKKRKALRQLPRDLPQTYDRILREIDDDHVELVRKTLQWIISAAEPLPIEALLDALAVSDGDDDFDDQSRTDVDTLLECCSSLVKTSQTVQGALELAHFSVKQYLLAINSQSPPQVAKYQITEDESTLLLAQACLTYLNFQCFRDGPEKSVEDHNIMVLRRPFLPHASKHWDFYAQGHMGHPSIMSLATSLFSASNIEKFRHWNQAIFFSTSEDLDMESGIYNACMEATQLHWAALLALHELLGNLLKNFSPNCDSGMGLPLYCALCGPGLLRKGVSNFKVQENKQTSRRSASRLLTVQSLLAAKADPNSTSIISPGYDNLHVAFHATDGQADFVTPLLTAGAKVTAETLACAVHLQDDVELLIGVTALVQGGEDSLQDHSDRDAFAKLKSYLPSHKASFAQNDERSFQTMITTLNRTEISKALDTDVRLGLASRVQAWLKAISNSSLVEQFSDLIQEQFRYAIRHEWREMVEIFLDNGARVDRESFSLAVRTRASKIVERLLMQNAAAVEADDLFVAVASGDFEIFSLLQSTGIDMFCRNSRGSLLIQEALQNDVKTGSSGRLSIIMTLNRLKPPLHEPSFYGDLPIHSAARVGMSDIVGDFISRGSPVDTEGTSGYRPTHCASIKDSTETMQMLLDAGVDINAKRGGIGGGPLHYSAARNAYGCTRLLIEAGADLEQLSSSQYTPLLLASMKQSWNAAEALICGGANINVSDPETQYTPLMLASKAGALEVVELIVKLEQNLDSKNLDGESALFLAAKHNHIEIVDILLKSRAKPDAERKGHDGTPLHWVIADHSYDIARLLLDYDAELETLNSLFQTPLLVATCAGAWELAQLLVSKGANVNVKDNKVGITPLHAASVSGQYELVKILLDNGAEVNARSADGRTALLEATWHGNLPTVKLLVERGADIHVQDYTEDGNSALSDAIRHASSVEVAKYLLELGAEGDLQANGDKSCLVMAIEAGHTLIVEALLSHGVDVNAQRTATKHTPIMRAIRRKQANICKILLEHNADLGLRDASERTVAHQIMKYGNAEILKLFLPYQIDWERSEGTRFFDFEANTIDCGISPLHLAAKYNFPDSITLLFDNGLISQVNGRCGGDLTPLHFAANEGNLAVMEALLAQDADIDAVTAKEGQSALHIAARCDNLNCVSALLERNANPDQLDKHGRTAADLCSIHIIRHVIKQASKMRGSSSQCDIQVNDEAYSRNSDAAVDPRAYKLITACEKGDLVSCRQLVSMGVDCNTAAAEGSSSPLLIAMSLQENYNQQLVHYLIDSGADINARAGSEDTRAGYQAIHFAIWTNSSDTLRKVLDKGANMSDFGLEPIHIAAYHGNLELLSLLLESERTRSSSGSAQRMLDVQVREDRKYPKMCIGPGPVYATGVLTTGTALHIAAYSGNDDIARKLLDFGAMIDAVDDHGWTPLHHAVSLNHLSTVRLLLDSGANKNARDQNGSTPFLLSVNTDAAIMEEIISRSPELMAVDLHGRNATYYAADLTPDEKNVAVFQRLLELEVPFDLRDIHGYSLLSYCLRDRHYLEPGSFEFILDHCNMLGGFDSAHGNIVNMLSDYCLSPAAFLRKLFEHLSKSLSPEEIQCYMNNQCEVYGTPLYWTSYRGDVAVMDLLVEAGADISLIRGPLGSGLNAACAMGRIDAIKWLLKRGLGPVDDKTLVLASKHQSATALLTRYMKMGVAGLDEELHNPQMLTTHTPPSNQDDISEAEDGISEEPISIGGFQPLASVELQASSRPPTSESMASAHGDVRARGDGSPETAPQMEIQSPPIKQEANCDGDIDQVLDTEQAESVLERCTSITTIDDDHPIDEYQTCATPVGNMTLEATLDSLPLPQSSIITGAGSETTSDHEFQSTPRLDDVSLDVGSIRSDVKWHIRHITMAAEVPT